jgi:hypothetical protein
MPSWVISCRTEAPDRRVVISPASRSTVAWWLAAAGEMLQRFASSVVVQPVIVACRAAARVEPSSAPSASFGARLSAVDGRRNPGA